MNEPALQMRNGIEADRKALAQLLAANSMEDQAFDPAEFLLAEKDGRLAGAARLEWTGGEVYLRPIVIASWQKGQGIGRAIIEHLLHNTPVIKAVARGQATNFYRKLGFVSMDWSQVPVTYQDECDQCPDRAACQPVPMVKDESRIWIG
jgi:N-acetylglutamate synthase-like GNAT family acetyltransferase